MNKSTAISNLHLHLNGDLDQRTKMIVDPKLQTCPLKDKFNLFQKPNLNPKNKHSYMDRLS